MAKKKDNLKSMSRGELEKKLVALREDLRAIHFKAEGAKSKNVKQSAGLRKQVAQVLTAMNVAK
ncbi:MAG TPA: 50S ribosomal protein L29 [Candidatus Paceibacterota bacterium]